MNTPQSKIPQAQQPGGDINIRDIIAFVWQLRYWIVISTIVVVAAAYVYLKLQTPTYERTAQIMLANERSGSSELMLMSDLTGMKQSSPIDNEIFIFRSPSLMTRVVESLNLNTRYYEKRIPHFNSENSFLKKFFSIKQYEFYKDNPFTMELNPAPLYPEIALPGSITVEFSPIDSNSFILSHVTISRSSIEEIDSKDTYDYGTPIPFKGFTIIINAISPDIMSSGNKYSAVWVRPNVIGSSLSKRLTATVEVGTAKMAKTTDVITLKMTDSKTGRAEDVLNTLISKYNEESRTYKNASVKRSIEFIDQRLSDISKELGKVESTYRTYQSSNTLVNIEAQSQLTLTSDMQYESKLTEIKLQQSILKMIKDDMGRMAENEFDVIPSNIGVADVNLNSVIDNYNILVAERNRMLANSSASNPRVRNLDLQLKDGRNSIVLSINNLEKVYSIREREIEDALKRSKENMSKIPTQQFDLTQIERKQQIIEPLYLLLQQKREESQISMYTVVDNARIIEAAYGSSAPVSPKSAQILLLALILGCCVPPGIVWLLQLLRVTVLTREDITKVMPEIAILSTLPKSKDTTITKSSSGRDVKSESFRMLRSKLKFLPGNVIQITSSISGEGKSFVASNLAASISHVGKRVIILGLDLRKPKLPSIFPDVKVDSGNSIVSYLIGKIDDPALTVQKWPENSNLDIAYSGAVPPNPTELLSTNRLETLMQWYRSHYDYIICDTAPMLPVSDSLLINKLVDITIYVVRSEYTPLKLLPDIKSYFEQNNIKSPNIVLNDLNMESKNFRYGYGTGYGYGYGYGSDDDDHTRKHHHHHHIFNSKYKNSKSKTDA